MACPFNKESLAHLKLFVDLCKSKPELLHIPDLKFFKDYVESLGGAIPEPEVKEMPKTDIPAEGAPSHPGDEDESDSESLLEFDMEGCMDRDEISPDQKMGDETKEPTEEETDKADELRTDAMAQFSEGNYAKAIELFTEAILVNPQSGILFTKRGQTYLKLNKPNACIKDCTQAMKLNCVSAAAYKFRGRAHRLLGDWEAAAKDLRQAAKIDYDEQVDEWLKEVQPNALKIEQHKLKLERKQKEKESKARRARMPGHSAAAQPPSSDDDPLKNDFQGLFNDPDLKAASMDPEVSEALQDIVKNPANFWKYQNNPKLQALFQKISSKFGGGAGFPGGFPGAGGGFPGAGAGFKPPQDDNLD